MTGGYGLIGSNLDVISFDNIEYAILRDSLKGLSGIPVEYDTSYAPGVVGAYVNTTKIVERDVTLHIAVLGNSRAEIEARRRRLIDALNPIYGESKFLWQMENGDIRFLYVRPDNGFPAFEVGTIPNPQVWDCTVELICYDPCWYSYNVEEKEIVKNTLEFKLPFQVKFQLGNSSPYREIINNGDVPTPVVITLHGQLTAPLTMTNVTTGQTLVIKKSLGEGETLIIDTSPDDTFVQFIDASGNITNAMYYCTVGSQFWQLEPGINIIHVEFTQIYNSASGTLAYSERWLGL